MPFERRETEIHGRRITYRCAGEDGPLMLLVHGITQDSTTWAGVAEELQGRARLVAPDLPGHGESENPPGDHSLGAYASALRDLLFAIEEERVTVVGHSLGGGVALQFSYQFPDMIQRLVLVDSGGLGRDVSPILRAATLPGADLVLSLATSDAVQKVVGSIGRGLSRFGLQAGTDLREVGRGLRGLDRPESRHAFLRTVHAVISPSGQAVSARDRLYLAEHVPTLIVWGARDRIIPIHHGAVAQQRVPGAQLRVIEDAGHFPHLDRPRAVAELISRFLDETEPADVPREEWGRLLREGPNGRSEGADSEPTPTDEATLGATPSRSGQ
jgi:pimeloyl-ACP methyl ester carboxylesterase